MTLAPFFASSSGYGFTKNLLSLPFQAPVFFGSVGSWNLSIFEPRSCAQNKNCLFFEYLQMILVPFFASSTGYGSTKNLLSLPFQAPVFFGLTDDRFASYNYKI